ncbi:hypothetical protein [Brachybacterium sp. UNK5269]|uniref:hypothetical protein n=1 Tax=Brachybacterium sp. UNK5269 TaxID=3408576 RepID=UPI003BAEA578
MDVDTLQRVLRAALLLLVALAVSGLTRHMVRRPHRHRTRPSRRLLPRWMAAMAVLFLAVGSLLALLGLTLLQEPALSAEDLEDGRGMSIAGIAIALGGLFFLWVRIIVYVEATPAAFVHRGVLGRTTTVRYADLVEMITTSARGAVTVTVIGRDGTRFTAALGLFDLAPFERWKQQGHERAREGAAEG